MSTGQLTKSPCPLSHFDLYVRLPFDVRQENGLVDTGRSYMTCTQEVRVSVTCTQEVGVSEGETVNQLLVESGCLL